MEEQVTLDKIIETLKGWVEDKQPIAPSVWVDAAAKMNLLLDKETDKLFDLQQKVAQKKLEFLECDPKRNVSAAKLKVETTNEYREMRQQEARIKRIEEQIKISKIQGKMRETEFRGY